MIYAALGSSAVMAGFIPGMADSLRSIVNRRRTRRVIELVDDRLIQAAGDQTLLQCSGYNRAKRTRPHNASSEPSHPS